MEATSILAATSSTAGSALFVAQNKLGVPPMLSALAAVGAIALLQQQNHIRPLQRRRNNMHNGQRQRPLQKQQYQHPLEHESKQQFSVPSVSLVLVAVMMGVYYVQAPLGTYSLCPWRVFKKREYYRILTHVFVHSDQDHLWKNLLGICLVGINFEFSLGSARLLESTLVAMLLESCFELALSKQALIKIPGASNKTMMHAHMVGFSGIFNFWLGMMTIGCSSRQFVRKVSMTFLMIHEVMHYNVRHGSMAHISGAIFGMIYAGFGFGRRSILVPKNNKPASVEGFLSSMIPKWLYVPAPPAARDLPI